MVRQTIIPYAVTAVLIGLGLLKLAWFTLIFIVPILLILVVVGKIISDRVRYGKTSISLKQ